MFSINVTKAWLILKFKIGCGDLHIFEFGFDTGPAFDVPSKIMYSYVLFKIEM